MDATVVARQLLDPFERQHAYFGVLERDRLAIVTRGADAVGADDLPRYVVPGNLLVPILRDKDRLARAGTDRVERGEWLAGANQYVSSSEGEFVT